MCGIAGVLTLDGARADEGVATQMASRLTHRGPDAQSSWSAGPVALAHTRLSIIDLAGSAQPMRSGSDVMVYNGEAFNYRSLRAELGGRFESDGDTEVMLKLLQVKGVRGLREVRGQFALALWSESTSELVLARDALGILPLYWWTDGTRLVFASEVAALLQGIGRDVQVDRQALWDYLGRRSVPAPRTLFAGVRKLRPGHALTIHTDGRVTESRWTTPTESPRGRSTTFDEAVSLLDDTLRGAVEQALTADVPVGAYLSGGVDSALICAFASSLRGDVELHTYCATFDDPRVDEGHWARLVSEHLGTRHTEVRVTSDGFVEDWERLTRLRGAPLSEPADIAVHRLATAARKDVTVVLSGEGSDELFAGYPKYRYAQATRWAGMVPAGVRGPTLRTAYRRMPPAGRRLGVALRSLSEPSLQDRYAGWFAPFTVDERAALLGERFVGAAQSGAERSSLPPLLEMLHADQGAWLSDNLLERGDRMSMAASLELRPPFLDPRVVDLARSLPPSLLLAGGQTKAVVKAVARRYLPGAVVDRAKSGFKVPLDAWFRGGLRDMANDLLTDPASFASAQLDARVVRGFLKAHDSGESNEDIRLWTLLSLEVWAQSYRHEFGQAGSHVPAFGRTVASIAGPERT